MPPQVLVIFGSQYGYTEKYARWIAESIEKLPQTPTVKTVSTGDLKASDISSASTVVIGASDYGGLLTGASDVTKFASELSQKSPIFFSVSFSGLDGSPAEKLDAIVEKNFGDLAKDSPIFHYRGGLDHKRLSFRHKSIMVGIRAGIAAIPHKSIANVQMLESFEQSTVDYSDQSAIGPLVSAIGTLIEE